MTNTFKTDLDAINGNAQPLIDIMNLIQDASVDATIQTGLLAIQTSMTSVVNDLNDYAELFNGSHAEVNII